MIGGAGQTPGQMWLEWRQEKIRATRQLVANSDPAQFAYGMSHTYRLRPHLSLIGRVIAEEVARPRGRLMIFTPPQVGKSVLVGEWTALWWLARNPSKRIALGSYAASLAETRGRRVRDMIREDYGDELGLRVRRGAAASDNWELETGGGMRCTGVGGSLTGFPAALGIIDDPHKDRAEADSSVIREGVWDWWSSTFLSRLAPGASLILVQTRWHLDDLAGRLLKREGRVEDGGKWRVVSLPAIATEENDLLGRSIGDPLPHPALEPDDFEGMAAHWEDKRATSIVRDWAALYQADPVPAEGALLTAEVMIRQRCLDPPAGWRHAVAVDPSGGGRDLAGIIGGHLAEDNRLYITHDRSLRGSSDTWSREACLLAAELDAERLVVEVNFGADMALLVIRTAWEALQREGHIPKDKLAPRIIPVSSKKGKLLRAEPVAQQWIEDRVRTGRILLELESEWQTWQPDNTESPGRIDASVHLAYAMLPIPGADVVVSSPVGVRRDSVVPTSGWASTPIRDGRRI